MNKYQQLLKPDDCYISIILEKLNSTQQLHRILRPSELLSCLEQKKDYHILMGKFNGRPWPKKLLQKTVQDVLPDITSFLKKQKNNVPDLFVTGGFFQETIYSTPRFQLSTPTKDHTWVYVYNHEPWTDLPVYRITDTQLQRIYSGCVLSPRNYDIDTDLDIQIRNGIEKGVLFHG